jgi:hypothetical protein
MATEDGEEVAKIVFLPKALANNPETVEVWYQKYVPKGHLLIDVEPVEVSEATPAAEQEPEVTGFGDSLDYVGEDKPTEEISEEMAQKEQDAIANLKKEKFDKDKAEFESLGRTFTGDFSE